MGVVVAGTLTADARPCPPHPGPPPPGQSPTKQAGSARYCRYPAGFTRPGGSRNAWSGGFGGVGYFRYPPNMCTTPHRQRPVWRGFDRRGSLLSTARRLFEMVGGNGGGSGSGYGGVDAVAGEGSGVDEALSGDGG